jgi:hypothetical protein
MDLDLFGRWLPVFAQLGILAFHALNYGHNTKRHLTITEPADGTVFQERTRVSGIGAPAKWKVLILHHTTRWFLQDGAFDPDKNGCWIHDNCHFDKTSIGADRTIVALAVRSEKQIDALKAAFQGWGPDGNKTHVKDWPALLELLKTNLGERRYELSESKRVRRVS